MFSLKDLKADVHVTNIFYHHALHPATYVSLQENTIKSYLITCQKLWEGKDSNSEVLELNEVLLFGLTSFVILPLLLSQKKQEITDWLLRVTEPKAGNNNSSVCLVSWENQPFNFETSSRHSSKYIVQLDLGLLSLENPERWCYQHLNASKEQISCEWSKAVFSGVQ